MEALIIENNNDESINLKKKMKSNESILKSLKGKALIDVQECIHTANEVFKNINLNNDNIECSLKLKLHAYEIWGKFQNIDAQNINVNESNLDSTICTLIEALRVENVQKANYNKDKANTLLNKLVSSAKKRKIVENSTSVELWLLIVQSSINVNNYYVAFLCINNCFNCYPCIFQEKIDVQNKVQDDLCRYWIIKALLLYSDLILKMIENQIFYKNITEMKLDALKYCVYALINIRYLTCYNSPLYIDVFFRIWNNIVQLLNHKESYPLLQQYTEKIVTEINIINNNKLEDKNIFIHYSSDLVSIFVKIIESFYNVSCYNNKKDTIKTIIEKSFRNFPTQFHKEILEMRLKYYYNNENGTVSSAIHELDEEGQSDLWYAFSMMETYGQKKSYLAIQNSIRLSNDSLKKADKMIAYADWMYKYDVDDDEINSLLLTISTILENVFEKKETEIDMDESAITSCSITQLELIIKMYCIRILVQKSKKNVINMIRCCSYYISYVARKTFNKYILRYHSNNPITVTKKKGNKQEKEKKKGKKGESKEKEENNNMDIEKNKEDEKIKTNDNIEEEEQDITKVSPAILEKCGSFPTTEKEWLEFKWPSILVDYIYSYESDLGILCMHELSNGAFLNAACINIVLESINLECYSYALPYLWLSYFLTTYWLKGIDQIKSYCIIYTLYSFFGYKLGFENIHIDNYLLLQEELTNADFDFIKKSEYKTDTKMLSVFNQIPFDMRSIYLEIAHIYNLLKKDIWDTRHILKNIVVNTTMNDRDKSKYYYYNALTQYYITYNFYDESIAIVNKTLDLKCNTMERMKAVILKMWCAIRQNKLYKFLEGDMKRNIQNFLEESNCKKNSVQYINGHLYFNIVITYVVVIDKIKTDELFDDIFQYIEKAEEIFESQEDYLLLIKCLIEHALILVNYVNYDIKRCKESFIKSISCINKAEKCMDQLLALYDNTLMKTILENDLKMKIVETKTTIYRIIFNFVDPVLGLNELNENIIKKYLLTLDIDQHIIEQWKVINNEIVNEIIKYYKLYINQNKTSTFLYNCNNCFSIYLKSKKTTLPQLPDRKKSMNNFRALTHRKCSTMPNPTEVFTSDSITQEFLINTYKQIINCAINEKEYEILGKASEELLYLTENHENMELLKFMYDKIIYI